MKRLFVLFFYGDSCFRWLPAKRPDIHIQGPFSSPGTLYPILHGLEWDGLLQSEKQVVDGKARKYYLATEDGKTALTEAMAKVCELMDEVEDQSRL